MRDCLLRSPYCGPGLQPRPSARTGNRTSDPLVHRLALNPLSHTSQGSFLIFFLIVLIWEREREKGRERPQFVVPLIYAFIGWFLYFPRWGIEPKTLAYWEDTLTRAYPSVSLISTAIPDFNVFPQVLSHPPIYPSHSDDLASTSLERYRLLVSTFRFFSCYPICGKGPTIPRLIPPTVFCASSEILSMPLLCLQSVLWLPHPCLVFWLVFVCSCIHSFTHSGFYPNFLKLL